MTWLAAAADDAHRKTCLTITGMCLMVLHAFSQGSPKDKKETGKSPQEYIQLKVMNLAKEKVLGTNMSVNDIAYELGFKYPQHFTRAFKKNTGYTPHDYRKMN